jgi:hypothetical protein
MQMFRLLAEQQIWDRIPAILVHWQSEYGDYIDY